jgi:AcrR family transcriptional regulator
MAKQTETPSRRGPKGDKRERTRAKLIEVAAQVVGEKGYERVTLEEVTKRAGMTRGAIYGNFKNREDLILAVVESRWQPIAPTWLPGAGLKEQLHLLGEAVVAAVHRFSEEIYRMSTTMYFRNPMKKKASSLSSSSDF